MLSKDEIKEIALSTGFKLKEQADGSMDLNPYVYDFVQALRLRWLAESSAASVGTETQTPQGCKCCCCTTDDLYVHFFPTMSMYQQCRISPEMTAHLLKRIGTPDRVRGPSPSRSHLNVLDEGSDREMTIPQRVLNSIRRWRQKP